MPKTRPRRDQHARRHGLKQRNAFVPLGKIDLHQAKVDGWQQHHLNHLLYIALWLKHSGKIDSPMAFAKKELVDKRPDAYSKEAIKTNYPVAEISAWLKGPEGPLRASDA